jgi:hypothetical protein
MPKSMNMSTTIDLEALLSSNADSFVSAMSHYHPIFLCFKTWQPAPSQA